MVVRAIRPSVLRLRQAGCPLAAWQGCALVCCPHCGYQMVDEKQSTAARVLRRLWPAGPVTKPQQGEKGQSDAAA